MANEYPDRDQPRETPDGVDAYQDPADDPPAVGADAASNGQQPGGDEADGREHPGDPDEGGGRKKWFAIGAGLLLLGAGAAVALYVFRPQPPQAEPPPQTPLVQTVPAEVRSGRLSVEGNGTVVPRAEVGLSPQVSGRVVYVNPKLVSGGAVQQGEVLVRLDARDYQNRVAQAEAQVAQRQVELLRAQEERAIAIEEFQRLQARTERRGLDGPRVAPYEGAFEPAPGAPVPTEVEGADLSQALDTAGTGALLFQQPQLEAAQAGLQGARAQLQDAQLALERTTIEAPFAGRVRSEQVDLGQVVSPGQQIASLYSADAVEIVVPLTDDKAALIPRLWQLDAGGSTSAVAATVTTDYGGERFRWRGYVDRAQAAIDPQTRTIDVVVRVPRPFAPVATVEPELPEVAGPSTPEPLAARPPLLVGMYTTVFIEGEQVDRYLVVPRSALRQGDGEDAVWVVRQDSLLARVPVDLIQEVEEQAYLFAPEIQSGEAVITSDLDIVTDRMVVRVADGSGVMAPGGASASAAGQTARR